MIKECYPALLISLVVQRNSSGIDAAATLYCVFPLESSDMRRLALASSAKQNIFRNISSCKCASSHNCLYYKSHPLRSGLPMMLVCIARDSGGIRTHDPQLRRLLLYPTELRNHHTVLRGLLRRKNKAFISFIQKNLHFTPFLPDSPWLLAILKTLFIFLYILFLDLLSLIL